MRLKFLSAVLLALPLPIAALWACARAHVGCCATDDPCVSPNTSDGSACCPEDTNSALPKRTDKPDAGPIDPDRQIVFKVGGLTCPAVKGIGCGHMLQGVLESLDKLDGVATSSANYTGTMIRISVMPTTDRDKVAGAVRKALTDEDRNAARLTGDELKRALDREQWRGAGRIGELSAIEFHTLALHRVKTFAKAEKLDKPTTDKLAQIAEQQWERLSKQASAEGATRPNDWGRRIKASLPIFLERAKDVLSAEQVERFKQRLTGQCADEECPEAPPAPPRPEKAG